VLVLLVTALCHFHFKSWQGCCVLMLEEKYKDWVVSWRHHLYTLNIFHEHLPFDFKVIRRDEQVGHYDVIKSVFLYEIS